jgi:hypothetical protein
MTNFCSVRNFFIGKILDKEGAQKGSALEAGEGDLKDKKDD